LTAKRPLKFSNFNFRKINKAKQHVLQQKYCYTVSPVLIKSRKHWW